MADYKRMEQRLRAATGIGRRPVAIAFLKETPSGVAEFAGEEPSSCSFWRIAAEGRTFYTTARHHYNCPVGGYTHNIPLPEARAQELPQVLETMAGIGYLRMEEIPGVFRMPETPAAVVYAPLGDSPVAPDVVLFAGKPGRIMLLREAALRAGAEAKLPLLARPTCMALPAALQHGAVASTGCIGNRVYTGVSEDEMYAVVRGADLESVTAEAETIASANATLAGYHEQRKAALTTGGR